MRWRAYPHITQIAASVVGTTKEFSAYVYQNCVAHPNARQIIGIIDSGRMTLPVNLSLLNICILVYFAWGWKNIRMYTSLQIMEEGLISMCWWVQMMNSVWSVSWGLLTVFMFSRKPILHSQYVNRRIKRELFCIQIIYFKLPWRKSKSLVSSSHSQRWKPMNLQLTLFLQLQYKTSWDSTSKRQRIWHHCTLLLLSYER